MLNTVGDRSTLVTATRINAMKSMDGVSDMTIPLGIHMFGYTAASPAAVRPTQGPATVRPSSPTQRTTSAPSTAMVRRCTVDPA